MNSATEFAQAKREKLEKSRRTQFTVVHNPNLVAFNFHSQQLLPRARPATILVVFRSIACRKRYLDPFALRRRFVGTSVS